MAMKKILLVDDSTSDLENLRDAVSGIGAQIFTANSGSDAVDRCKKERPDLVLMDVVMGDFDGYKACREMQADAETKDSSYDERRKALAVCVTKLNERQQKLIAERYHRGLSVEAIADELRQSANTIAQALFRARKNLLSCIRQAIQVPGGA